MKTSSLRQVIVALTIAVAAATVHGAWFASTGATATAPLITISTWDYYTEEWRSATIDLASTPTVRHSEDTIVAITGAGSVSFPAELNALAIDGQDGRPSLESLNIPAVGADSSTRYFHLLVSKPANYATINWPATLDPQNPWSGPIDPSDDDLGALDVEGSVGIHTVTVDGSATFIWDIGRWSKGDIFLGLNNHTYKVLDRNGNFKRFVASADYDSGVPGEVYNVTTGCATNWKTGEVFATNFGDYYPGVNIIGRQIALDGPGDLSPYSSPSRRLLTRVSRLDDAAGTDYKFPYTDVNYPVDSSPESVAFDGDMNMYVGHSFGNFRQAPKDWEGDPSKPFDFTGEWDEYTQGVDGRPLEAWQNGGWGWVVDETGVVMNLATPGSPLEAFDKRIYGVGVTARLAYDASDLQDIRLLTSTAGVLYPNAVPGLPDWSAGLVLPQSYLSDPVTGAELHRNVNGVVDATRIPSRWSLGKRLHRYDVVDGGYLGSEGPDGEDGARRDAFWTFSSRQGTDWIDLDVTGEVMYYTSEDSFIHRYRVKPGVNGEPVGQLPDVGFDLRVNGVPTFGKLAVASNAALALSSGGGTLDDYRFHGLRILPPGDGTGGFLVAVEGGLGVHRFNKDGKWVQRYWTQIDRNGNPADGPEYLVANWYTIEVDPGGRTFWASAHDTGKVFQFDIASGRVLKTIDAVDFRPAQGDDAGRRVEGICIMWEYTAPQEICFVNGVPEGQDNDGDGYVDENCVAIEVCSAVSPGDDDGDGFVDQYDTDCGDESPPVARDDQYSTNQDVPLSLPQPGVLRTGITDVEDYDPDNRDDTDINNDTLTVIAIGQSGTPSGAVPVGGFATTSTTQGGSVTVYADGRFDYQPAPGFHGLDTFVYRISDGLTRTDTGTTAPEVDDIATVTILVRPLVVDDEFTMPDRLPLTVPSGGPQSLLTDDSSNLTLVAVGRTSQEALSNRLSSVYTLTGVTTNNGGVVVISADGTFTYTPAPGFTGTDRFYYIGNDGVSDSYNVAEVRIIVPAPTLGVTAEPVCIADVPYVTFTIAANYAPVNGAPVTITWFDSEEQAVTTRVVLWTNTSVPLVTQQMWPGMVLDGTTPIDWPGWILSGGLWSEGSDGFENTRPTSTVRFSVNPQADVVVSYPPATPNCNAAPPANLPPIAVDDTSSTTEDTPVTISVLPNDSDPENGPLTVTVPTTTTTRGGTVTVNPNGTIHYVPVQNFCGVDTFVYTITDAAGLTDTATVTVTVSCVRDVPTIVAAGGTFQYDRNPHGGTCTVTGVLGESLPGVLTYTPGGSVVPVNVGTYTATCSFAGNADYDPLSATATVIITPRPATVTAGSGTKVVGAIDPALNTTHTGFLGGDVTQLTFNSTRAAGETVGTYPTTATATGDPLGNYSVQYFPGVFTITPSTPVCTIPAAPAVALVRTQSTFDGTLRGSVQLMQAVGVTLNSTAVITGDLMMPGTPSIINNGPATYTSVFGTGASTPTSHQFIFNAGATLGRLVRRTDAVDLPVVSAPPSPTGSRSFTMNLPTDNPAPFATLRDLTLNSNVGPVTVPAGNYGTFTANTNTSFVVGVAGATTPAVYNFQSLTLNSGSALTVVGPVVITVGNSMSFNGPVGALSNPEWLTLRTTADVTLNTGVQFHGYVEAPNGRVTINSAARLLGGLAANSLTINSGGVLELVQGAATPCDFNLVVKIDDKTKVYGDPDPALTYQLISGGPVPPGGLTGAIARVAGEPVGSYVIGQGTLGVSGEYTLQVIPGTLTVTPRPATVTAGSGSKVFGTMPDPALSAIATTGFLGADLPGIALSHERAAGEAVNTYAVTPAAAGDVLSNYTVTYFPGVFEITKAPSVTTPTGNTYTYDGTAKPQTCSVTGAGGVTLTGGVLSYSPGGSTPPRNVGTYAVTCDYPGDANHLPSSGTSTVRINPLEAIVRAGSGSKTYGESDPSLTQVTTSGFTAVDVLTLTLSQSRATGHDVGSYATTATALGSVLANYSVTYIPGTFTINPAPLTVQAHNKSRQVGEPNPTLDGVITGVVNGDVITATYATPATVASPAGSYVITPTLVDVASRLGNYAVTIIPGTLTITAAPVCTANGYLTYSQGGWGSNPSGNNPGAFLAANFSRVYPGGSVQIGGTKKLTFTSAAAIAAFLPQGGSSNVLNANATNPTSSSAGNFAAQLLAMQLATDFSRAGVTKAGLGGLTMQSGPLAGMTVDAILAMANTVIGGTTSALPSGMSMSQLSSILESLNMNYHEGTVNEGLLGCGGTPPCSATQMVFTGDSSVSGTAGNIRTFTAGGVSVKASAFSRVKGTNGAWATAYLGVWNEGLGVTDTSENGSNDTHKTDNNGRLNYVLFEFSEPVIISKAFLDSIGGDSDATVWFGSKVDPFNNHLTLSDALLTSLGAAQASSGGGSERWAEFNGDAVTGNVLVIAADVAGSNDAFKISKLQLECGAEAPQPVAPTIAAVGGTFVYSGAAREATCSVTDANGAALSGTLSYAPGSTAPTQVGTYTATCAFAGNAQYSAASATATVTITPAPLTVVANNKTKVQGTANPALDGTLTGVIAGDGITATYSTTATTSSAAGTYPIVPALVDPNNKLSNYSVTKTDGVLTVTPSPAVVAVTGGTFVYDRTARTQTCTVKNQAGASVGTGTITYTPGGTSAPVNVGTYAVTCTFSGNTTYGPASASSTVVITPKAATVTAGNGTKVYGTADPALSAVTTSGFISADLATLSLSQARASGSTVGTYVTTVGASGAVLSNYAVSYQPGAFTITKAPLTAAANNKTKTQGSANPTLDGTLTGVVSGDTITASYATTATTSSPVGTYPITVTLVDPGNKLGNYTVTTTNGTLTVTASTPACTARTFTFTGSSSTSGTAGNVRTLSVSGVSVRATAHSRLKSSNTWANAYLGVWAEGLGVTDGSEGSGGNDTHKVDNGGDRQNYVLLRFSQSIVITKAYLDSIGADSDAQIWIGTVDSAYANGVSMNDARLAGLQRFDSSGSSSERWASFNGNNLSGNVVIIAATTDGSTNDAFKVSKVQSSCSGS